MALLMLCIVGAKAQTTQTCDCVIDVYDETENVILTVGPGMVQLSLQPDEDFYNINMLCLTGESLDTLKRFILPGSILQPDRLMQLRCCNITRTAVLGGISTDVAIKTNTVTPHVLYGADRRIILKDDCIALYNLKFDR